MKINKNNGFDFKLISNNSVRNLSEYVENVNVEFNKTLCRRFFRGHSSIYYELKPSIYRKSSRYSKNKKLYVDYEDKMYFEALTYCSADFPDENSVFENLVKLQHYEFPTRLLDLTMNSLVALYFAVKDDEEDGEVYMFEFNKKEIHHFNSRKVKTLARIVTKTSSETLDSKYNEIIPVVPKQNFDRLMNQNGAFLLFGANNVKTNISENKYSFKRIIILREHKKQILKQLNCCGINGLELFPDILSRLKYIKSHTMDFV